MNLAKKHKRDEWGYNSKPLRECTENLNGRSSPAQVRSAHAHFK
jgi:hypothetical protein